MRFASLCGNTAPLVPSARCGIGFLRKSASFAKSLSIDGSTYNLDENSNVSPHVLERLTRGLHRRPLNPIHIVARRIREYFAARGDFAYLDALSPVVSVAQNFDSLGFPSDHPSRKNSDTYYLSKDYLLRTHATAHQVDLLRLGSPSFLLAADCYRRDEIDRMHYPVFHQLDGFRSFPVSLDYPEQSNDQASSGVKISVENPKVPKLLQPCHTPAMAKAVIEDLHSSLEGLCAFLFGPKRKTRWVQTYFPFTTPSWELEIQHKSQWLEILGCGIVQNAIFEQAGAPIIDETVVKDMKPVDLDLRAPRLSFGIAAKTRVDHARIFGQALRRPQTQFSPNAINRYDCTNDATAVHGSIGWAFGIGLERLAMVMFGIPDIRAFWTKDSRFEEQFADVKLEDNNSKVIFKPLSVYPSISRDLSFWLDNTPQMEPSPGKEVRKPFCRSSLLEIVRSISGDCVERVTLKDSYVCPQTGRSSLCFRIVFRAMERTLSGTEITIAQGQIRDAITQRFQVLIR